MHITLPKRVIDHLNDEDLELFGRTQWNIRNADTLTISISSMTDETLDSIKALLQRIQEEGVRRVTSLISDIDQWQTVSKLGGASQKRASNMRRFADLLTEYIRTAAPRTWVYTQTRGTWLAYHVNDIEYHPSHTSTGGWYHPASCSVSLLHWAMAKQESTSFTFHVDDVDARTIIQALGHKGYTTETPTLRDDYLTTLKRFNDISGKIGTQYLTSGRGVNLSSRDNDPISLSQDGRPAKVVLDSLSPTGDHEITTSSNLVRTRFWPSRTPQTSVEEDSDDLLANMAILHQQENNPGEPPPELPPPPEVPVHPYVPVYHLTRHARYRVHSDTLDEYVYDTSLTESLILPDTAKNLVNTLIGQARIDFADIVEGKGSGACILLDGEPGVGKTLTAEVIAEGMERPLMSIQAAQLGVSPDKIEENLASILSRSNRLGAVLLLDEADVYITERGTQIAQNAIVAAFLRTLESHQATVFLTTNYGDTVDDAIASRCLARISYTRPSPEAQRHIWEILNRLNQTGLSSDQMDQINQNHPDLTGRDIKQLLKLGSIWSANHDTPLTPDTITFVQQFQPTRPKNPQTVPSTP